MFEFEGVKYYKDSDIYWFITKPIDGLKLYDIEKTKSNSIMLGNKSFCDQAQVRSKIFPTEQLCKDAMDVYIWHNHKLTPYDAWNLGHNYRQGDDWKEYIINEIIKQQQA